MSSHLIISVALHNYGIMSNQVQNLRNCVALPLENNYFVLSHVNFAYLCSLILKRQLLGITCIWYIFCIHLALPLLHNYYVLSGVNSA